MASITIPTGVISIGTILITIIKQLDHCCITILKSLIVTTFKHHYNYYHNFFFKCNDYNVLGNNAFWLARLTSLTIPSSVTTIGIYLRDQNFIVVFILYLLGVSLCGGCPLTSIIVADTVTSTQLQNLATGCQVLTNGMTIISIDAINDITIIIIIVTIIIIV